MDLEMAIEAAFDDGKLISGTHGRTGIFEARMTGL